jgi:CheY-like chemotaxis protein
VHAPAAEYGRHPARVLIVDDEEMVRQVAAAMLKELGVGTMEATGGEEALRILRAQGQGIDLVLLDHNMPLMDGVAAFREMKKVRPDIKILLASGYSEKEVSERFSGLGPNGFIQKPYNLQGLSAALRRSLQD